MKNRYSNTDEYYIFVVDRILKIAPIIGAIAAMTFTAAKLAGRFSFTGTAALILFDVVCLSYFLAAYAMRKVGIMKNGAVDQNMVVRVDYLLGSLILLQWNLITYIFPTSSFWGYAPMFVLLSAFTFHKKAVLFEITGISVSIAISWLVIGDKLLPEKNELYPENLSLRIVALAVSFSVIYILTHFAERFTRKIDENFEVILKKNEELDELGKDIIAFTADIIEERDATSGTHVKRLKTYTRILARAVAENYPEYGLNDEKVEQIALASILHDVGKIAIPDSILNKPGRLTPEEFETIKSHTTLGARIIDRLPDSVGEEYKRCCRDICRFHHEKYDGRGYPAGLKGDDIPISAQIVSVVDCYDALTNERPYKPAYSSDAAINMIVNGECGAFSEKIIDCLIKCKMKLISGDFKETHK